MPRSRRPPRVVLVALPETAGSALYGMLDVLKAAGNLWQQLLRSTAVTDGFDVQIGSTRLRPFRCGHGVPVAPTVRITQGTPADIIIVPELWLGPDQRLQARYEIVCDWIRRRYRDGACVYSACSGAVLLAETGLLDGREATSHWGYIDLFRREFPRVKFRPEPNLCFGDPAGRLVTAGGTTSWHDLALHVISRHLSPGEALRIAKVYLMKWHPEGQLPFQPLVRPLPHPDATVRSCEDWLAKHFAEANAVSRAVSQSRIPARTLKRRFKQATGMALIDYVQNLRIEEAKRILENTEVAVDEISARVGYEDASFFRRLFRRQTGLTPADYRRFFQPMKGSNPSIPR